MFSSKRARVISATPAVYQLAQPEGDDVGASREPRTLDLEGQGHESLDRSVLARVDLDLHAHRDCRRRRGGETEHQREHVPPGARAGRPEPRRQRVADLVGHGTDRPPLSLYEIDVLGVPRRRREVELVQRSSAAERDAFGKGRPREEFDQDPRQHEVLLDLCVARPWGDPSPRGDVRARDHRSGSTSSFTTTRQRGSGAISSAVSDDVSGVGERC